MVDILCGLPQSDLLQTPLAGFNGRRGHEGMLDPRKPICAEELGRSCRSLISDIITYNTHLIY